ncbi:helix-turn-helix transcriptional regulator [Chitinophaga nivalis]|uniref:AraC family transcriptional regulator n=1 Tax=Chitinophaga nivalis TaxID=2991709 RepID=A0ABT3ILV9_9BACT|nr:AraC family transcriptional regulator [Chitinophaga nivalis]MCW3465353.1 AraC family transcriptional regulator [Chitinophaga nivalis]MCW3484955.1 AraC family transcriptional regulator [Chitinophaga nivalis]
MKQPPSKILYIERKDKSYTTYEKIPPAFHPMLIQHARYFYSEDANGLILDQQIDTGGLIIYLHIIKVAPGVLVEPFAVEQVIALHVSDTIPVELHEGTKLMLRHEEVSMFNVMPVKHAARPNQEYAMSFHINLRPSYLPVLAKEFPVFKPLADMHIGDVTAPLHTVPFKMNAVSRLIRDRILSSRHIGSTGDLFYRRNAVDFFANYTRQLTAPAPIMMNQTQHSQLNNILTYIVNKLDQPHTPASLCLEFGIHRDLLKGPFEQEFNISLEELVLQEKMAHVFEWLVTTRITLSQIAKMVGYPSAAQLQQDFETYYNCHTAALRNEQ